MKSKADLASEEIKRIFKASRGYTDDQVSKIAFHLTDWFDDLNAFSTFLNNPRHYGDDEAMEIIIKFLAHAPAHLEIAAELVLNPDDK